MFDTRNDEALFDLLGRLVQTAKTVHHLDRRNVLLLQADIRRLRSELNQRCSVLTEQIRDAGARTAAISAYARTGSIARQPPARQIIPTE